MPPAPPWVLVGDDLGGILGVRLCSDGAEGGAGEVVYRRADVSSCATLALIGVNGALGERVVVTGSADGELSAVNTQSGRVKRLLSSRAAWLFVDRAHGAGADGEPVLAVDGNGEFVVARIDDAAAGDERRGSVRRVQLSDGAPHAAAAAAAVQRAATPTTALIGGDKRPVELWDVEHGKRVFQAKNVRPDKLGLQPAVKVSAVAFLSAVQPKLIAAGSAFGELSLYDARLNQRRPVHHLRATPERRNGVDLGVSSIVGAHDGSLALLGDVGGNVVAFDVRAGRMSGAYKGHSAGVRALLTRGDGELLSCGLDRCVHAHDLRSRRENAKLYVKRRLTSIALAPPEWSSDAAAAAAEAKAGAVGGGADDDREAVGAGAEADDDGGRGAEGADGEEQPDDDDLLYDSGDADDDDGADGADADADDDADDDDDDDEEKPRARSRKDRRLS